MCTTNNSCKQWTVIDILFYKYSTIGRQREMYVKGATQDLYCADSRISAWNARRIPGAAGRHAHPPLQLPRRQRHGQGCGWLSQCALSTDPAEIFIVLNVKDGGIVHVRRKKCGSDLRACFQFAGALNCSALNRLQV